MGLLPCPNLPLWPAEKSFSSSDENHFPLQKKAFSPAVPFHLNPQPIMLQTRTDLLQDTVAGTVVLVESLAHRCMLPKSSSEDLPCKYGAVKTGVNFVLRIECFRLLHS